MKTQRLTWLLGVSLMAGLVMGCGGDDEAPPPSQPRLVRIFTVGGGADTRLTFPGTVQAADRAELAFRVTGPLIELPVKEGDTVTQGQLVAKMDPRDFRIAVEKARADFDKAESDMKRFQRLFEREAVPLSDLELARSNRDVARSKLDQAEADLRDTELKAPFSGWIGRRLIENFEQVNAHQTILTLHDLQHLEIVIDVPQDIIANLRGVGELMGTFSATGNREYPLKVKEYSAEADPSTRTYQVTLALPAPEEARIMPGMTAQVIARDATDGNQSVFVIPLGAVVGGDGGDPYVWIVSEDKTVTRRDVKLGQVAGGGSVEVTSGLTTGDTVVTSAVNLLVEGTEVRTMEGR